MRVELSPISLLEAETYAAPSSLTQADNPVHQQRFKPSLSTALLNSGLQHPSYNNSMHLTHDAGNGKHCPASVHALGLSKPGKHLCISSQAQRVISKVSWQRSIKVCWWSGSRQPHGTAGGLGHLCQSLSTVRLAASKVGGDAASELRWILRFPD